MPRIKKTKTEPIEETPVENVSFASEQTKMKDCCDRCGSCERCLHPVGNIRNYIPLLILLLIIAAFLLGALVTKVTWLQDKVTGGTSAGVTPGQQQQAAAVKPLHVAQSTGMDADKFNKCFDSGHQTREVATARRDGRAR